MPEADATEPFVESCQFPTWIVGADSIRPWHKEPLRGACVPGRLLVDPYRMGAKRFLSGIEPGVSPNALAYVP